MLELERLIAEATTLAGGEHPCRILGHKWKHIGGKNCGCEDGGCSVPVHECEACGDCDYGDNAEAEETREICQRMLPGDAIEHVPAHPKEEKE